jgi:amino acid transporter
MTLAKLSPLLLLVLAGIAHFLRQPQMIQTSRISSSGWSNWVRAIVLLMFPLSGWEESLTPTGEVREPRRTIPFALWSGLTICAAVYTLLQFITVATVGPNVTEQPLTETAAALLGGAGVTLVSILIMLATYGYISGNLLNDPRLIYSLAVQGDFPHILARIHPRFHTPAMAIIVYAFTGWVLAVSGAFQFVLALAAGATVVYYAAMCASLIRLRKLRPNADAFRIPFGSVLSVVAVVIALALITGLKRQELLLMCITALFGTSNWLWARKQYLVLDKP